ncbi:MAG: processing protein [Fusobacteriaceae bacterium]|jgi:DNA processing protein|nr:protecting protein DprA [Fusobacteriales bacterium]MDN5303266.1 processing protein [Fusobacteriaceae bacterium]
MLEFYKLLINGIDSKTITKIIENYNSLDELFNKDDTTILKNLNITNFTLEKIYNSSKIDISKELERLEKLKIKLISINDPNYPLLLKNISSPPPFLHVKGKLNFPEKTIGIVGTRKMSDYGKMATEKFTKGLVDAGVTIISGLASGVDAVAHSRALKYNGTTIGVVANGLDKIYPEENRFLWEKMENEGTIISEYPLGTEPFRWNFPERNRIIAGLSRGILVCESYKKGGSLITAKIAHDENREVFAVPGFFNYPSFEGCNQLIQKNIAKLVIKVEDIIEEFDWNLKKVDFDLNLSKKELIVYTSLLVPKTLDELILDTNLDFRDILIQITQLELKNLVKSISGGKYQRIE